MGGSRHMDVERYVIVLQSSYSKIIEVVTWYCS